MFSQTKNNYNVKRRGTTIKELFVDISFVISQDAAINQTLLCDRTDESLTERDYYTTIQMAHITTNIYEL
jgi:hypothetical protein